MMCVYPDLRYPVPLVGYLEVVQISQMWKGMQFEVLHSLAQLYLWNVN